MRGSPARSRPHAENAQGGGDAGENASDDYHNRCSVDACLLAMTDCAGSARSGLCRYAQPAGTVLRTRRKTQCAGEHSGRWQMETPFTSDAHNICAFRNIAPPRLSLRWSTVR
jgi:hypothetical protein